MHAHVVLTVSVLTVDRETQIVGLDFKIGATLAVETAEIIGLGLTVRIQWPTLIGTHRNRAGRTAVPLLVETISGMVMIVLMLASLFAKLVS